MNELRDKIMATQPNTAAGLAVHARITSWREQETCVASPAYVINVIVRGPDNAFCHKVVLSDGRLNEFCASDAEDFGNSRNNDERLPWACNASGGISMGHQCCAVATAPAVVMIWPALPRFGHGMGMRLGVGASHWPLAQHGGHHGQRRQRLSAVLLFGSIRHGGCPRCREPAHLMQTA
jgi:hypothetical protein